MHADAADEPVASVSRVNTQKTPNTETAYSSQSLILYISDQTTQHHTHMMTGILLSLVYLKKKKMYIVD